MVTVRKDLQIDGLPIVRLESEQLQVDVAPEAGGRVAHLIHKPTGYDFLWRNENLALERKPPGSEYDPNFYGGIDELLPNDLPESINAVACPDHGELWTLPLIPEISNNCLTLRGRLPRFGLTYERQMRLRNDSPWIDFSYRISNPTKYTRQFLWKLHAAVRVQEADVIECPAGNAQVVDPAWSRFKTTKPFAWPQLEGRSANVVPAKNGTMDFFYLFDLQRGEMFWRRPAANLKFGYQFDTRIFPYAWLFASWGGFLGHYTIILEPCTAMPMSVNEAAARSQCSKLEPGEAIDTEVNVYAGSA